MLFSRTLNGFVPAGGSTTLPSTESGKIGNVHRAPRSNIISNDKAVFIGKTEGSVLKVAKGDRPDR